MLILLPIFMFFSSICFSINITDLKAGGYVLFFRHLDRDLYPTSSPDPIKIVENKGECRVGTELNAKGIERATKLGEALRAHGIPATQIYASPLCRNRQTSELMFGHPVELRRELVYPYLYWDAAEGRLLRRLLNVQLSEPTAPNSNRILISHLTIFSPSHLGTVELPVFQVGDAYIFRPLGEKYEYVGRIAYEDWFSPPGP